jgi:beta-alanine--pyruvate transaminase
VRGYTAMERGFHDEGVMFRVTGDTIALTPPLIISEDQIGELVDKVGRVIKAVA